MVVSVCYLHVLCVGRRSSDSQDERPKSRIKTTQIIFVYETKKLKRNEDEMETKQRIYFWSFAHLEPAPNVSFISFYFPIFLFILHI